MLITKMLGILFWEVYQNHLIPTITTQTTIAITIIIETIIEIIATTIITVIVITVIVITTTIIAAIITILPTEVTTLRQIDFNAKFLTDRRARNYDSRSLFSF